MTACVSLLILVLVAKPVVLLSLSATTTTSVNSPAPVSNHKLDLKLLLDITNVYVVRNHIQIKIVSSLLLDACTHDHIVIPQVACIRQYMLCLN